jgi:hypothetical protein
MWQSVHHKVAGQMLAQRMGWWYLDMSGKWFSPAEIAQDIATVNSQILQCEADDPKNWRPSTAIAIDEQGMLMRNSIGRYYSNEDHILQDQIRSFAASGVPMETCMTDDLVRNPERANRYKVIFFANTDLTDINRKKFIEYLNGKGIKSVFLSAAKPILPADFSKIVRDAGGYVPTSYGLQVDMNGNFISLHAMRSGMYDFNLPYRSRVVNMKTGQIEANGITFKIHMTAGETRWYSISAF